MKRLLPPGIWDNPTADELSIYNEFVVAYYLEANANIARNIPTYEKEWIQGVVANRQIADNKVVTDLPDDQILYISSGSTGCPYEENCTNPGSGVATGNLINYQAQQDGTYYPGGYEVNDEMLWLGPQYVLSSFVDVTAVVLFTGVTYSGDLNKVSLRFKINSISEPGFTSNLNLWISAAVAPNDPEYPHDPYIPQYVSEIEALTQTEAIHNCVIDLDGYEVGDYIETDDISCVLQDVNSQNIIFFLAHTTDCPDVDRMHVDCCDLDDINCEYATELKIYSDSETTSSGVQVGGESLAKSERNEVSSGGIQVGGVCQKHLFAINASTGEITVIDASGLSLGDVWTLTIHASDSADTSDDGTAVIIINSIMDEVASGGILVNGESVLGSTVITESVAGGILVGGEGVPDIRVTTQTSGGIFVNGDVAFNLIYYADFENGLTISGAADREATNITEAMSGGVVVSGRYVSFVFSLASDGQLTVIDPSQLVAGQTWTVEVRTTDSLSSTDDGSITIVIHAANYEETSVGGIVLSGAADSNGVYIPELIFAYVSLNSEITLSATYMGEAAGGILVPGEVVLGSTTITESVAGGILVAGSAIETFDDVTMFSRRMPGSPRIGSRTCRA